MESRDQIAWIAADIRAAVGFACERENAVIRAICSLGGDGGEVDT